MDVFALIQHPHQWKPKLYFTFGLDEAFEDWRATSDYLELSETNAALALQDLEMLCDLEDRGDGVIREFMRHVSNIVDNPEFSGTLSVVLKAGFEGDMNLPSVCDKNKFDKLQFIKEVAGDDMHAVTIYMGNIRMFSFEDSSVTKTVRCFVQELYEAQCTHNKMSKDMIESHFLPYGDMT